MSRNFYVLACTLILFSLVSCGMMLIPASNQPGLPENASLWKTTGLGLLAAGLVCALVGVMTNLFEQANRRSQQQSSRRKRP